MNIYRSVVVVTISMIAMTAHADPKRAAIADTLNSLSARAAALGSTAKAADDRGARKKFAPAATELGDDLAALARRVGKDVPMPALGHDAAALDKQASSLVELADESDDKDTRKSLRAQALLIAQGVSEVRKTIDGAKDAAPAAATRYTGRLINNSDSCAWAENLRFVVSRDGQQVFATTNTVFPGKEQPLVLEKGVYLVRFLDTSNKQLGQANLDANREGWTFKTGCVNQD
jgi:hypothetical protein